MIRVEGAFGGPCGIRTHDLWHRRLDWLRFNIDDHWRVSVSVVGYGWSDSGLTSLAAWQLGHSRRWISEPLAPYRLSQ